jgi:hypothetical protein
VTDVADTNRYEARFDDALAGISRYIRTPELIAFVHTEVEPEYEGRVRAVAQDNPGPVRPPLCPALPARRA